MVAAAGDIDLRRRVGSAWSRVLLSTSPVPSICSTRRYRRAVNVSTLRWKTSCSSLVQRLFTRWRVSGSNVFNRRCFQPVAYWVLCTRIVVIATSSFVPIAVAYSLGLLWLSQSDWFSLWQFAEWNHIFDVVTISESDWIIISLLVIIIGSRALSFSDPYFWFASAQL